MLTLQFMKGTEILEVIIGCVEEHHTPIFCSHLKKMIEHGRQWTPAICHTHSSHAFKTALKPMSTNNTTASDFKFYLLPFLHIHTHTHTHVHTHTHSLTLTHKHTLTHTHQNKQPKWVKALTASWLSPSFLVTHHTAPALDDTCLWKLLSK